jgi:kynurenine formamidase
MPVPADVPILRDVVDLSVPFHDGMPCDDFGPKFWERTICAFPIRIVGGTGALLRAFAAKAAYSSGLRVATPIAELTAH